MKQIDWTTEKVTHTQAVMRLLWDLQWHTNRELGRVGGNRYGSRVAELIAGGWQIEDEWLPDRTQGKKWRLTSRVIGEKRPRMVKVYLPEHDAASLTRGQITITTHGKVREALERFRARKR